MTSFSWGKKSGCCWTYWVAYWLNTWPSFATYLSLLINSWSCWTIWVFSWIKGLLMRGVDQLDASRAFWEIYLISSCLIADSLLMLSSRLGSKLLAGNGMTTISFYCKMESCSLTVASPSSLTLPPSSLSFYSDDEPSLPEPVDAKSFFSSSCWH
jgi:hypothetical protein